MIPLIICLVLSYLIGSLPTSIIIARFMRGIDIRKYGSGNAGFTNVARVLGWKPAIIVFVIDILKGFAVTFWLAKEFAPGSALPQEAVQLLAGAAAVAGHIWTVFASFKGGKGVLTALGMFLALLPFPTLIAALTAGLLMYIYKYVSLGSITGGIALPVIVIIQKYLFHIQIPDMLFAFSILIALLIVYTHRTNMKRLLAGTETKIGRIKTDIKQ